MFAHGFRSATNEGHKNTFMFMLAVADEAHKPTMSYFDRMRIKRHQATYDAAEIVTQTEARNLLSQAATYVNWINTRLSLLLE